MHVARALCTAGDPLSEQVRDHLMTISYGKTTTYSVIARALGNPNMAQAVGQVEEDQKGRYPSRRCSSVVITRWCSDFVQCQPAGSVPPGMSDSGLYGVRLNRKLPRSRYCVPSTSCRCSRSPA